MNNLISICLATYNGEKYLEVQLDSIINQTYKNIELIVQDDCSSDNTIAILESYQDKLNIKIYKNEKNIGYIKNFESVLQKASGDFIAICDQDDIWEEDKLEILISNIGENSLIYSNSLLIDSNGKSLNRTLSQKLRNNFIDSNTCLNFLYDNSISAHAMLFKKELLKYIFPFPKNIYFDAWIGATAASLGGVKYIDKNLVHYRQHSSNTLGNVKKHKISATTKVLQKVEKKVKEVDDLMVKIKELKNIKSIKDKERDILNQLEIFYRDFENRWFNLREFLFLLDNGDKLFKITRKSKLNLAFKKSIGKKLYKVAPFL